MASECPSCGAEVTAARKYDGWGLCRGIAGQHIVIRNLGEAWRISTADEAAELKRVSASSVRRIKVAILEAAEKLR